VNDSGQVIGASVTAAGETHAFLWTAAGGMVDLGTLGGFFSLADGINNSGIVVGLGQLADGEGHATLWQLSRPRTAMQNPLLAPDRLDLGGATQAG
jgi:probable HAF family extracellular repeat protein